MRRNTVTNLSQTNNYDGIWIEGVGLSNISGNSVTQTTTAGLGDSRAIRSSGGWANVFELNCVDNTNAGLQFYDMADYSDNVSGNSMNNHITGLQLGEPGIGNVFIGDQYHTGNIWDLGSIPGSGFGGVHWGGPFVVGASEFFVDETENPALNPPVDPGSGWFVDQGTSEPTPGAINCSFPPNSTTPRAGEDANPTDLDLVIAADTLPTDIFQNETRWKGAYRLCRKMLRNPDLALESTLMTTFKAANATLSTGKLAYIAEERGQLFDLTTNEQAISDTLNANTEAQMETLRLLDSLRQSGAAVNATLYATVLQERADAQALLEQFTLGLDTTRQQKIQTLLSVNASVSPTMRPDSNHKTVNIIFLTMLAVDSISASNLAVLAGIAEQCPLEGGDAVYEARAIVSYLTGEEYEDRVLCAKVEQRDQQNQAARVDKGKAIAIYPNPATNIVYWRGTGSELVTIKLYNQLGQLQLSRKTTEGFTQTGKLLAGFYTMQIHSQEGDLLTTQRLIIQ
ncbi:MAG: T9SS type A sorting domain-containing protein [Lewinellaceae bacterium]|nr:T9SS type A sorting domain-containing protein [Lewinellaceae bacterium]